MKNLTNIDKFFVVSILIGVFFLRYIKLMFVLWYIPELIVLCYVIVQTLKKEIKVSRWLKIWLGITICYLFLIVALNIYKFGVGIVFIENILMIFMPAIILIYLAYLTSSYSFDDLFDTGKKILVFLNFYFWLNVPIIILQFVTGTFMIKRFLSWGKYDFDHMTGLIGPFGTGILNVFWCSLLIGNLFIFLITKKRHWLFSFLIQIPTMIVLSYFNENKSFIPTALLFVTVFFTYSFLVKNFTFKSLLKLTSIILIGILFCFAVYFSVDIIKTQIDKLFVLANQLIYGIPDTNNERAYLNYLAFQKFDAIHLGEGINSVDFNNQKIHPNLGINSMSLILIHGGIWYFIAVVNFYSTLAVIVIKKGFDLNTVVIYVVFIVIFGFLSIITQPFRDHYIISMISLLALYVTLFYRYKNENSGFLSN
ncbi:hypothetical protein [Bacillus sp. 1NLA3E]|uniref:hypothetical protein n=1 Tax=Bacillus sp. 1NLA3E TaxID=666686 RepID=UPI000247EB90|nr:hypothetical protein [Bacillus sp. 1NLA3E]AGK55753.1 hypothetical protein B1NLA3E_20055 [Bacillus sp. 1NLA3E]